MSTYVKSGKRPDVAVATVAFVPVVHRGYVHFFEVNGGDAYVLGQSFLSDFPKLERDIRALIPQRASAALSAVLGRSVRILEKDDVPAFTDQYKKIIMPDEDVSEGAARYMPKDSVQYVFALLRWDKKITDVEFEIPPDRSITKDVFVRECMERARREAVKSPDWWRQIGALLVKDGRVIATAHNKHLPHPKVQDALGDPRSNFDAGERLDTYLSVHAEIATLVRAARDGISVEGADMYVTTFPCANCARALALSGIKRLYYESGYSRLDAEPILKSAGIEIVLVQ